MRRFGRLRATIARMDRKREQGRYFTELNPFRSGQFLAWAEKANLPHEEVLEPFAGSNNLIRMLEGIGLCDRFASYDLHPASDDVRRLDTIRRFPGGFGVCVTNPPWLARNSASRKGLAYPDSRHDDLYKHCLELCLENCPYVAAIVPATYLQSGLFRERLQSYTLLHRKMFVDTDNPVCLSLFVPGPTTTLIYHDEELVGDLSTLECLLPEEVRDRKVRFNDPDGRLGFVAFDSVRGPTIGFCEAKSLERYPVKVSARFFARVSCEFNGLLSELVTQLNDQVQEFRRATRDVFLTPFKGIRKDGQYRRRMSFWLARRFINAT